MKCTHKQLIIYAGLFWVIVGSALIIRGVVLLNGNSEWLYIVGVAVVAGLLKAYFVLRQAARRTVTRIIGLTTPVPFYRMYSGKWWLLILLMIGMGMTLMVLHVSPLLRGAIIIGVGVSLLVGSIGYWQELQRVNS